MLHLTFQKLASRAEPETALLHSVHLGAKIRLITKQRNDAHLPNLASIYVYYKYMYMSIAQYGSTGYIGMAMKFFSFV